MADEAKDQVQDQTSDFKVLNEAELSALPQEARDAYLASEYEHLSKSVNQDGDDETIDDVQSEKSDEVSNMEETESESQEEISEPAQADNQKDINTRLAELEKALEAKDTAYKELQAEFTRRNQERKRQEESVKSEKSMEEKELDAKLAQLQEKNPDAVALFNHLLQKQLKDKVAPLEERVSLRDRQLFQQTLKKEIEDFKDSPYSEFESEAAEIVQEALNDFQEHPATLNEFLLRGDSLMENVKSILFKRHQDKVLEAFEKWKKKKSTTTKPNSSSAKEVAGANIGNKPSKSSSGQVLRSINEYSPKEIRNLDDASLRSILPFKLD